MLPRVHLTPHPAHPGDKFLLLAGPVGLALTRPQVGAVRRCVQEMLACWADPVPLGAADGGGLYAVAVDGVLTLHWGAFGPDSAEAHVAYGRAMLCRLRDQIDAALFGPGA